MIALRVGPDIGIVVVGAPAYFADHPPPQTPRELSAHRCLTYLLKTGGVYAWDFEEDGRPFEVRVQGPLVFNDVALLREKRRWTVWASSTPTRMTCAKTSPPVA